MTAPQPGTAEVASGSRWRSPLAGRRFDTTVEVRPYLAAHAYLLGSFNAFHAMGGFHRLRLSWRIFGHDRVNDEIARVRTVLAKWGYQLGREDDQLLPNVVCQLFLFNRSPHLEDLNTELFDRFRGDRRSPSLGAVGEQVARGAFPPVPGQGSVGWANDRTRRTSGVDGQWRDSVVQWSPRGGSSWRCSRGTQPSTAGGRWVRMRARDALTSRTIACAPAGRSRPATLLRQVGVGPETCRTPRR